MYTTPKKICWLPLREARSHARVSLRGAKFMSRSRPWEGGSCEQTGRKGGSFHRGASVGWASTRGCWRHQMDPFLVLSLFNAAPYLTLDECWVITPFITQITLKNYSTLKCFTTMKEIFLYQHDGKLILCLIRQLDFTLSHSQSEFPTRQETIFVLFLDWILDACNYYESGSIFMVQ